MSAATAMAGGPAVETTTVYVTRRTVAADGLTIIDPGRHTLPAEHARKLVAAGLAHGEPVRRFHVLHTLGTCGRVMERGEIHEVAGMPELAIRRGLVRELAPGEAPGPVPVDDNDPVWWVFGPVVRVKATRPGPCGRLRAHAAGEELELRECDAIECEAFGKVEILGPLTAAGSEFRVAFARWKASGAVERPGYAEVARPHRRAAERAAAAAAAGELGPPVVACAFGRPLEVAGELRRPGEEFSAPEALVAEPYVDHRLEISGRVTARFHAFVGRIADYRSWCKTFPDAPGKFPTY